MRQIKSCDASYPVDHHRGPVVALLVHAVFDGPTE